jgi:CRISPR-associated endonuclease/helicase Cas3
LQFSEFFDQATNGCSPYPYQQEFAESEHLPEVLIAPTGSGKEFTIILGWLYRLLYSQLPTPRRLVYCLPMRTLVEQVYKNTSKIFESLGLTQQVGLFKLMGGVIENDWDANPLRPTILIGTQDQLQSRALHRGYAMNRYRWTVHFALLNDDCLWVFDETQLMGAGLATSAQLQGLRDVLKTYNRVHSLWMSATLDTQPLKTVNHPKELEVLTLSEKDRQHEKLAQRLNAKKRLAKLDIKPDKDGKNLAKAILEHHTSNSLTLVVLNQVARAQAVYRALKKQTQEKLLLVHSRFREADRNRITEDLEHFKGIVIATQAIEAGVNLSAKLLMQVGAIVREVFQMLSSCGLKLVLIRKQVRPIPQRN